jgi:large subunit ribosomal protein L47
MRLRNREKNKSRGVSAIRRTGPRVPLSVSKYTLPEPVWNPPGRQAFKTREDHGLWGFFNEERTAMTPPEDLDAHGRAWSRLELVNKDWDDLWKIWWKCVRERNWLSTDTAERQRMDAGYGDGESAERDEQVSFTIRVFGVAAVVGLMGWAVLFSRFVSENLRMMNNTFHSPI